MISEHELTLTPDTIVPRGLPVCPGATRRLACDAHLDEMSIAAQLRRDRRPRTAESLRRSASSFTGATPRPVGSNHA